MTQKQTFNDNQVYLLNEFSDDFRSGEMGRREFILKTIAVAGGVAAAMGLLRSLGLTDADVAWAQTAPPAVPAAQPNAVTVPPTDPAIDAGLVRYPSHLPGVGTLTGYFARPAGPGASPGVVIIHENRGLLEHIKDVARRYAKQGFAALAPDLLSREGGTDRVDPMQVPGLLANADPQRHADDAISAGIFLRQQPGVIPSVYGMTGFCFGGGVAWRTATQDPAIAAAVPYYGPNPPLDDVLGMRAAVFGIYGALDQRINAGIPDLEAALQASGAPYQIRIYPDSGHAFFNDTGASYNPIAAEDAFARTMAWFRAYLPMAVAGK